MAGYPVQAYIPYKDNWVGRTQARVMMTLVCVETANSKTIAICQKPQASVVHDVSTIYSNTWQGNLSSPTLSFSLAVVQV